MATRSSSPWHKASFQQLMETRLPELLASRLPLGGYTVEPTGEQTCRVKLALAAGDVAVTYTDIPRPDDDGVFQIGSRRVVVVPQASCEQLEEAEIRCVGEQLYDFVERRLGDAPDGLPWDESLIRSWLPLDSWIEEFFAEGDTPGGNATVMTAIVRDEENWLAHRAHLRRIVIPDRQRMLAPGQMGRTCPFETPEGVNISRILHVAVGAQIRDGRLLIVDDRPEAALGVTASMVPFVEHDDPNRLLMGCNMMRQWVVPPEPEPALVQSGNEPDARRFWCGRNLLTAFVSLGQDTYEDAIVLSESAVKRFGFEHPIEPGDKLSNRHGTKGTVSRILPDEKMPHLSDGTPVELVFNFLGCHTRMNFGQIREAVMGRIAKAEGRVAVVPPFQAPSADQLRQRLAAVGLPECGMETLTVSRGGKSLPRRSTAGWVYWGVTHHLARVKIHAHVSPPGGQIVGEPEVWGLRDAEAFDFLLEHINTRSADRADADTLAARVATGAIGQAEPPTPAFARLRKQLAVAGVKADFDGERVSFGLKQPEGDTLDLAQPVAHPWHRDGQLRQVGIVQNLPEYRPLADANDRLRCLFDTRAPDSVRMRAVRLLEARLTAYLDAVLPAGGLAWRGRTLFSGRAVISPGGELQTDQVGVPEDIAWTLFGPLVARRLGDDREVHRRSDAATRILDELMAEHWVVIHRAPTILPTSFLAFRPVRTPHRVIRIHPLATLPMNADFDGDQASVHLPVTEAGQRDARERLSFAGHLQRDPRLIRWLALNQDAVWGLAWLSLTPGGLAEVTKLAGTDVRAPDGFVTRASLTEAMSGLLRRDGADQTLAAIDRLMRRGFDVTRESGASISPFAGESVKRPPFPKDEDTDCWQQYRLDIGEELAARTNYEDDGLGPQLLAVKGEARGTLNWLCALIAGRGPVTDARGQTVNVRRGLVEGLSPQELYACMAGAREALGRVAMDTVRGAYGMGEWDHPKGFNVLSRAMRSDRPGTVFARAAATGEIDPLQHTETRLFVGLPPIS